LKTTSQSLARLALAASLFLGSQQLFAGDNDVTRTQDGTRLPVSSDDVRSESSSSPVAPVAVASDSARPCHWWQFRKCDSDAQTVANEGLPPEAPRTGTVVTIDVSTNTAYLFQDGELVTYGPAATGTEKTLKHGSKVWMFHTPRGRLQVLRKIKDPVWTKPDWAFVEAGERIPPRGSKAREMKGHLGKYALDLGDGIMIHGTDDPNSLGRKASHGCIRLEADMLEQIYNTAKVGTEVFIFDSEPSTTTVPRDIVASK
jgi:L,D-transpeptidase YbiS